MHKGIVTKIGKNIKIKKGLDEKKIGSKPEKDFEGGVTRLQRLLQLRSLLRS